MYRLIFATALLSCSCCFQQCWDSSSTDTQIVYFTGRTSTTYGANYSDRHNELLCFLKVFLRYLDFIFSFFSFFFGGGDNYTLSLVGAVNCQQRVLVICTSVSGHQQAYLASRLEIKLISPSQTVANPEIFTEGHRWECVKTAVLQQNTVLVCLGDWDYTQKVIKSDQILRQSNVKQK